MKILYIILLLTFGFGQDCSLSFSDATTSSINITYVSSVEITGFQFNVYGVDVTGASGGEAGDAGFMISSSATTVIAFSLSGATIPAGSGTLLSLEFVEFSENRILGVSNVIISGPDGLSIPSSDPEDVEIPCNNADCAGECGGSAEVDECGECGGDGSEENYDCDGTPLLFINNNSTQQAFYYFETVTIDSALLEPNDWVGAFNGDVCVGARKWDTVLCGAGICEVPIFGDDGEELTEGYMNPGDIPAFKIYDASANIYYDATPSENVPYFNGELTFLDLLWVNSSENPYIDYCLDLHAAANLISFYAIPENYSVEDIFSTLGLEVIYVSSGSTSCYNDQGDRLLGSGCDEEIEADRGYWVNVSEAGLLCIEGGIPTDPAIIQYTLESGSPKLISFPVEGYVEISSSLPDDIEGSVRSIIGESVATIFRDDAWVGSLSALGGGNGYYMRTDEDISFSFDVSTMSRIKFDNHVGLIAPYNKAIHQSSKQAFYYIEDIENIEIGDWILAYNGDEVIGARQWTGEIIDVPAMGSDGSDYTKGYMKTGEVPSFKILKDGELINLEGDIPAFENNQLYIVPSLTEAVVVLPGAFSMERAYPNPFNPVTTLEFGIPEDGDVSIEIYNLQGRLIETLVSQNMKAGYHSVIWNADNHASGMYFVQMVSGEYLKTQKLMLVK